MYCILHDSREYIYNTQLDTRQNNTIVVTDISIATHVNYYVLDAVSKIIVIKPGSA